MQQALRWRILLGVAVLMTAVAVAQQRGAQVKLVDRTFIVGYSAAVGDSTRGVLDTVRTVLDWAGILSDSATVLARPDTAVNSRGRVREIRGRYAEGFRVDRGGRFTIDGRLYDTLGTWKSFTFERWGGTTSTQDTLRGIDTVNWDRLGRNRTGVTLMEFMTTPHDTGWFRALHDTLRLDRLNVTVYGDRQPTGDQR